MIQGFELYFPIPYNNNIVNNKHKVQSFVKICSYVNELLPDSCNFNMSVTKQGKQLGLGHHPSEIWGLDFTF